MTPDYHVKGAAHRMRAECRIKRGAYAEAEKDLLVTYRIFSKQDADSPRVKKIRSMLADIYDRLGQAERAREWRSGARGG